MIACANQCKKCANGTSCSACKDGTRNPANFCKCPDKFYEHSVTKCKSNLYILYIYYFLLLIFYS